MKNAAAVAVQLSLLLLVIITLTLMPTTTGRGLVERGRHEEEMEGICRDDFDMDDPSCSFDTCTQLCESKKYERLFLKKCLDTITCECTHRCRRPPLLT